MRYRAEIDGLRAVAVVPVVFFHAGFELFSGGFIGVDVFFVISGFLITANIMDDLEKNRFSILNFYERRARRILPALFFATFFTLMFSVSFLPPHAVKNVGESVVAVSLFLSNIFFYIETDYFANTAELAPLLHTWSLGVEEQFYIFFPVFLLVLKSSTKTLIRLATAFILILSFILAEWWVRIDSQFAFFMPITRFWELAFGSLIALYGDRIIGPKSIIKREILAFSGIILITLSIFIFERETIFPGINAIYPVLGCAMVIIFADSNSLIGKILSVKPLVKIGLISYSLYLSHNIVFALSRNIGFALSDFYTQITLITLSIIIAIFSFFYIEKPLRFIALDRKKYFFSSALCALLLASSGYFLHETDGLKEWKLKRLEPELALQVIDANYELDSINKTVDLLNRSAEPFLKNPDSYKYLILGDSKSGDLYVSLKRARPSSAYQFRRIYLDDTEMSGSVNKKTDLENVVNSQVFKDADEIILTATWQNHSNKNVVDFIELLLLNGKKVSLLSTSNFNDVASLSYVVAKRQLKSPALESFFYQNIRQDWRRQYLRLKDLIKQKSLDVRFLDKLKAFCDFGKKSCKLKDETGWYMYDSGHLTINGYDYFGKFILREWFAKDIKN